jgi:hypothetical protein
LTFGDPAVSIPNSVVIPKQCHVEKDNNPDLSETNNVANAVIPSPANMPHYSQTVK